MGERHRGDDPVPRTLPAPLRSPILQLPADVPGRSAAFPAVIEAWAFHDEPPAPVPEDLIGSYFF
jgi:hypothetical protein